MTHHPDIAPIAFLLGTWSGPGHGDYPTIEAFTYTETVSYESFGKPFVAYTQRTRGAEGPLHAEAGFIRCVDDAVVEMTVAQPTGVAEVYTGSIIGTRMSFESAWVGLTPTAKGVDRVARTLELVEGELLNTLHMAAVGEQHQWHLEARLSRTAES